MFYEMMGERKLKNGLRVISDLITRRLRDYDPWWIKGEPVLGF